MKLESHKLISNQRASWEVTKKGPLHTKKKLLENELLMQAIGAELCGGFPILVIGGTPNVKYKIQNGI